MQALVIDEIAKVAESGDYRQVAKLFLFAETLEGSIVKCVFPIAFMINAIGGCIVSFANIPVMCLYGVLTGRAVDYNEYLYGEKMVAISGGATSFGNKVGSGIGSVILTVCLAIGGYDAAAETATTAMRYSIYAFSNYLPLVVFIAMFFLFKKFDIADRITEIQAEVAVRKEKIEKSCKKVDKRI